MTSTEPLAHVSPSQDLKGLAAREHTVANVNEIGWCCSDFAGQSVEGTEIWHLRLHHIWGSNIFMQSLQRGHDVHLSSNHLEIQSSTRMSQQLAGSPKNDHWSSTAVLVEDMRTRQSGYCVVPAIENGLKDHIRFSVPCQLNCEPYSCIKTTPMSFHTNALSARANLPYQTGGIEKILQMICRQPLSKECRWWSLALHLLQISNMSAIFLVGCSLQHPATLPTSPNISQFRCLSKGWRHTEHIWSKTSLASLGMACRPAVAQCGTTLWSCCGWPTLGFSPNQLTNFGIQMESTHFLLCESTTSCWI